MPEYLFIRLLEACNADCFMCSFARSRDEYRLGVDELQRILSNSYREGIRFVRFTGGEPLMHRDIVNIVRVVTEQGMKCSIITNGSLFQKKAQALREAGLSQLVVSIDGLEETHDRLRRTPGLFRKCIEALEAARSLGVALRVNTVVGPANFHEVLQLQDLFTDLGVHQWELSSLKLSGRLDYKVGDREVIEREILPALYSPDGHPRKLAPFGKMWCGNTATERDRYFDTGSTPRADGACHLVDHVRYLDAKNGRLYVCPLVPHRKESEKRFPAVIGRVEDFSTCSREILAQAEFYRSEGPNLCTGCSSTAAGFTGKRAPDVAHPDWLI